MFFELLYIQIDDIICISWSTDSTGLLRTYLAQVYHGAIKITRR